MTRKDGDFEARSDILVKNPETDKYDIYEVKASSKVKPKHLYDLAFQYLVFAEHFEVGDLYVLHPDKHYVRNGELDLEEFFDARDVTAEVLELLDEVRLERASALKVIAAESPEGIEHCYKPFKECVCIDLCHPNLPEHSIYEIGHLREPDKKKLLAKGIVRIEDVPEGFLGDKQDLQVQVVKSGEDFIDRDAISEFLDRLEFPLYFLDFEASNPTIPEFDGYSPFKWVTFQYSLHVLQADGTMSHHEFLEQEYRDPSCDLMESMRSNIGEVGSVIVWHKSFEVGRIKEMIKFHPKFEDFGRSLLDRIVDLKEVFSNQMWVSADFRGSASLKAVLPVLVPEMDYSQLEVSNGTEAMQKWDELVKGSLASSSSAERETAVKDMLEYCEMDTLAMVKIYDEVRGVG